MNNFLGHTKTVPVNYHRSKQTTLFFITHCIRLRHRLPKITELNHFLRRHSTMKNSGKKKTGRTEKAAPIENERE